MVYTMPTRKKKIEKEEEEEKKLLIGQLVNWSKFVRSTFSFRYMNVCVSVS